MCGGHGLWGWLQTGEHDHRDDYDRHISRLYESDVPGDVEREVKTLYARGEINRETFQRLMDMAQDGYLTHEDVGRIRRAVDGRQAAPDAGLHRGSDSEEARLRQKIRAAGENARRATTDEERRAFLEIKQGAQYRLKELERDGELSTP
jgi:hypothetical protein